MSDIEKAIKDHAERAILKTIKSGEWLAINYSDRVKLPADFMQQVWDLVDTDKVKQQLATRLEEELANRIVNHMAAELATDVKQILSVTERREALRSVARDHMDQIMSAGAKS